MMTCAKCNAALSYGAKYCNQCGEKVPKGAYETEYNDTIWAKFDKLKDGYDRLFLKRITDSVAFKIISMVLVLAYFFITLYGNFMGIRLENSPAYTIAYNKQAEEYYIHPKQPLSQLAFYVPIGTENIIFTEVGQNAENRKTYTPEQYEAEGYSISAGEYQHIYIQAMRKDQVLDAVKVIVVGQ